MKISALRLRAFAFVFLGERLRNLRLIHDPFDFADAIAIDLAVFPMFEEPLEALLGVVVASLLVEFAEKMEASHVAHWLEEPFFRRTDDALAPPYRFAAVSGVAMGSGE